MSGIRIFCLIILFFTLLPPAAMAGLSLSPVKPAVIILPASPSAVEKTASDELSTYLEKLQLGKSVTISENVQVPAGKTPVYIGWSRKTADRLGRSADDMAYDEYEVRITDKGEIILAGHPTRGSLYAVYEFLESFCGVRWWTPTEEYVPKVTEIPLTPGSRKIVPAFRERNFHGSLPINAPRFNARKRRNANYLTAAEGGSCMDSHICFAHTMDRFVPDNDFFKYKRDYFGPEESAPNPPPEYFALRDGRRLSAAAGQPCTTHPDTPAYAAEYMARLLRRKPGNYKTIWLTQNDNAAYCMCDRCIAEEKRLGNRADMFIDFVNKTAAILNREFPHIQVATFAYQFTLDAPLTVRPSENVHIRVCLIEADAFKPLTHPANRRFEKALRDWCAISNNVSVWHYTTNFTSFGLIHPTTRAVAENYRLFKELGIRDIFTQDNSDAGSFGWLMTYRTNFSLAMMVDPDQDVNALQQDFFKEYYGPAAEPVLEFMNHFEDKAAAADNIVTCYQFDTSLWLDWQSLMQGDAILRKAEALVKPGTEYAKRVQELRTVLDWTRVWRHENTVLAKVTGLRLSAEDDAWTRSRLPSLAAEVLKFPRTASWKFLYTRMGIRAENHLKILDGFLAPEPPHINLPAELANVPEKDLVIIPAARYDVAIGQKGIRDYKGYGGECVRLHLKDHAWAMRVELPALMHAGEWEVFFEARYSDDIKEPAGNFAVCGLYAYGTNFAEKTVVSLQAGDFTSKRYTLHKLGCADFKKATQIYFGACGNASVPELLIGRIFLKRK